MYIAQEHSESTYLHQDPAPHMLLMSAMIKKSFKELLDPHGDQDQYLNQSSVPSAIVDISCKFQNSYKT